MTHLTIRGEALKRTEWQPAYVQELAKINATLMIAIVVSYGCLIAALMRAA